MRALVGSLHFLCRCLSCHEDDKARNDLRREISSGQPAWETVVFLANQFLITPALWSALSVKDLTHLLEDDLREYLKEIHRCNSERNRLIRQDAERAVGYLNAAGIEPVILKGGANLFSNPYGDLGARMMVDVDMLLPDHLLRHATDVLLECDYKELMRPDDEEDTAHTEPLLRDDAVARIELHSRLLHHNEPQVLTGDAAWQNARSVQYIGVRFRVLSPEDWLTYNVVHSEIRHEHFARGTIGMRDLYDLSVLWNQVAGEVDWPSLNRRMRDHGIGRPFLSYLQLAKRLFNLALPSTLQPNRSADLHYFRCMVQLRLSRYPLTNILTEMWFPFSATRIRRKYGCSNRIGDLTRRRLQHVAFLTQKYLLGHQRIRLWKLLRRGLPDC